MRKNSRATFSHQDYFTGRPINRFTSRGFPIMQLPLLVATHSDGATGYRRSGPSTRPTTPGTSENAASNSTHRCCSTSCGRHCTGHCICPYHRVQATERVQDKKKRQGNNQGQRFPAPSPAPSASSSTNVPTPVPQFHYVHSVSGYPVIAYGSDSIHAHIHPALAQAAPAPSPSLQQPAATPREAPPARCICPYCQQHATSESETRIYHCSCCHSEECPTEQTGHFDDAVSEGSNDAGAGAGAGSETSPLSDHYYQPCYLAVPMESPFLK
jgi:hypothetical protein